LKFLNVKLGVHPSHPTGQEAPQLFLLNLTERGFSNPRFSSVGGLENPPSVGFASTYQRYFLPQGKNQ
jgi:hypothetical protein